MLPSIALSSAQGSLNLIDSGHSCNVLYRLSSPKPAFFPSRFELLVSLGKEFFFLASKLCMRRHVSNRTVEPDRVVVMDVLCYCLTSIINAGQALGPYAIPFDRPMISLNLPIALGVVGRSLHMGHSCDAYELFEVSGDELRAVIRDDSRSCIGVLFSASLDNRFDIDLLHFLADFPMDNRAGTAVQDAAHEVKSTAYIQIADIDVPMLVGSNRLRETSSLLRSFSLKWTQNTGLAQNTINARWTCCDDVRVEHHECQTTIPFKGMFGMELQYRLSLGFI